MSKYKELVDLFMEAPDSQLDASMKPLIKKWSDPPTPFQILEVLDNCIRGSLASGFTVQILQTIYEVECKATNVGEIHMQIKDDELDKYLTYKSDIIGCDEVGYGCLAGPLVVCGVKAAKDWAIDGLNDSKKLSAKKREAMRVQLNECLKTKTISWHLAIRTNAEIDKLGVIVALKACYVEIFHALYSPESLIITDGNLKFDNLGVDGYNKVSMIKADGKVPAVMAASILAKTYRDHEMAKYHNFFPVYEWNENMGYPSTAHRAAIEKYGPCELHRFSYAPMKNMGKV